MNCNLQPTYLQHSRLMQANLRVAGPETDHFLVRNPKHIADLKKNPPWNPNWNSKILDTPLHRSSVLLRSVYPIAVSQAFPVFRFSDKYISFWSSLACFMSATVHLNKHVHLTKLRLRKLEVCHPRCVCENWKGYVVKHNYVN